MGVVKPLMYLLLLTIFSAAVKVEEAAENKKETSSDILYTLLHHSEDRRSRDAHFTFATVLPAHTDPTTLAYNPSDSVATFQPHPGGNIHENTQSGQVYSGLVSSADIDHSDSVKKQGRILSASITELPAVTKEEMTKDGARLTSRRHNTLRVKPEITESFRPSVQHLQKSDQQTNISHDHDEEQLHHFTSGSRNVQQIMQRGGHTLSMPGVLMSKYEERISCNVSQYAIDCSHRQLADVPVSTHSDRVEKFNLHDNFITALRNLTFVSYAKLRVLDLSWNRISVLEVNAFVGLTSLRELYLWKNNLTMTPGMFHPDVFKPLFYLEILRLNHNCPNPKENNYSYPDKALSRLKHLRCLHMDGLRSQGFGDGFGQLTSLTNLSLTGYRTGYCWIHSLSNTTFRYLSQLKHLDISSCYILGEKIESGAFLPLTNLVSIDLTHNEDIDIKFLDNVLYGLCQISTLKELRMRLIINRYSLGICLDNYYIRNLPQHLEYLDFGENNLEAVDRNVIRLLSPSLKRLDISGNRFVFGTYLRDLKFMENLSEFTFNGAGFTYSLPQLYPFQLTGTHSHHMAVNGGKKSNCTLYAEDDPMYVDENGKFILVLPPNLRRIEMNNVGLNYVLSYLQVDPTNSLEEIIMQHNDFPNLNGPFIGLHKLRHLDLSRSFVKTISPQFFLNLTSLRKVNLGGNLLGDFLSGYDGGDLFSSLESLTFLNLSFNAITNISSNVFNGLYSLEILLLGKNNIEYLDANLSFMNNLQVLDLHENRISYLPIVTRDHISSLVNNHIKVNLRDCPIMCDCSNLQFLTWITSSGAFDQKFEHYRCQYPDTSSKFILDGYNDTVMLLARECTPHTLMFFIVGSCMFVIVCIIICTILYRFRWKIRYLYYAAYLQYKRKGNNSKEHFEYDAFISYDQEDEDFVERKLTSELERRGLKLCIHGRDFRAGEYIASNVVRAVCASRRTVVVLTRHMMNSYWCGYEIQMANMESVHTGRPVLIFLLMEKIPESELGVELLYNIRNNTYIPYPDPLPDATSIGRLWDKLTVDIRTQ